MFGKMIELRILVFLWTVLAVHCWRTGFEERKCIAAGKAFENGTYSKEKIRQYRCNTGYVSNIPDLAKMIFQCGFQTKLGTYAWKARLSKFTDRPIYLSDVKCLEKRRCGDPPIPENMTRKVITQYQDEVLIRDTRVRRKGFVTGDAIEYSCKSGYILSGEEDDTDIFEYDSYSFYYDDTTTTTTEAPETKTILQDITCDKDGLWNGTQYDDLYFGECQEILCNASAFASISNGNITNYKDQYGFLENMQLVCEEGYRPKDGVDTAVCVKPSSFNKIVLDDFGCEHEYCPPPCLPPGATIISSSESYNIGDVLEYTCKSGERYGGSTNRTCMKNRYWSGTPIDCIEGYGTGSPPKFRSLPIQDVVALVDESHKFMCKVRGNPEPFIVWYHENEMLIQTDKINIGKYSLQVNNLKKSESGKYACRAKNIHGEIWANFTLEVVDNEDVIEGPDWYDASSDNYNDFDDLKGPPVFKKRLNQVRFLARAATSSVEFDCDVVAFPIANIIWRKNGILVRKLRGKYTFDGYKLKVESLTPDDRGNYTCVVQNEYGSVNWTTKLEVQERVSIAPIMEDVKNQTALIGTNVTFTCQIVMSDSQPLLQWLRHYKRNNSFVNEKGEPNVKILQDLKSSGFKSSIDDPQHLVLHNVTKEDQGWYTCLVANTVGMNYRSAWLTVLNETEFEALKEEDSIEKSKDDCKMKNADSLKQNKTSKEPKLASTHATKTEDEDEIRQNRTSTVFSGPMMNSSTTIPQKQSHESQTIQLTPVTEKPNEDLMNKSGATEDEQQRERIVEKDFENWMKKYAQKEFEKLMNDNAKLFPEAEKKCCQNQNSLQAIVLIVTCSAVAIIVVVVIIAVVYVKRVTAPRSNCGQCHGKRNAGTVGLL